MGAFFAHDISTKIQAHSNNIGWLLICSAPISTENLAVTSELAEHYNKQNSKIGRGMLLGKQKRKVFCFLLICFSRILLRCDVVVLSCAKSWQIREVF